MTKAGTSALTSHRRPLLTAAAAGGVLTALCFLPSGYASPDRAEAAPAHREGVTSNAERAGGETERAHDSQRPERPAGESAPDGTDKPKTGTDRPDGAAQHGGRDRGADDRADRSAGRGEHGPANSAGAESTQAAVASDGSDPTPYIVGGLGVLGAASAVLLGRSPRAASQAAGPQDPGIAQDGHGSPANTGIPSSGPAMRHAPPHGGEPRPSDS